MYNIIMGKWEKYQNDTYENKHNHLLDEVIKYLKPNSKIIDFGCGSGNDTVFMIKQGFKVLAIDKVINNTFFSERLTNSQMENLTLKTCTFENFEFEKCDMIMSFFALPFCNSAKFLEVWGNIYNCLNKNGLFVGQLFGDRDKWRKAKTINTFSKDEVLSLLERYEILYFKEIEYNIENSKKKWHYFDIIAKKISK